MNRNSRLKMLLPVIGCCMLLLGAQLIADLIFTVWIAAGMNIDGLSAAEADALLYEKLMEHSNGIMLVAYLIAAVGLLLWAKAAKRPFAEHTGLNLKTTRPIGILALLAGIAANIWFSLMLGMIPWPEAWLEEYAEAASVITAGGPVLEFVTVVLLAPLIEEILFRGMAYRYLCAALPAGAALIFQGLLFGGMHGSMIWMIYASILGCIFGYVRRRTGSLHATILMHIGFNGGAYLFDCFIAYCGDSGMAVLGALITSAMLFLLMLYGIEFRMGEDQKTV